MATLAVPITMWMYFTAKNAPKMYFISASRYGNPGAGSQPLAVVVSPSPSRIRPAAAR